MYVVGIDPGIRDGGMVLVSPDGIKDSTRFGSKSSEPSPFDGDPAFGSAVYRAQICTSTIVASLKEWQELPGGIDLIAVEGFVDLPSRKQHRSADGEAMFIKDRWKTPLLIGMLHPYLRPWRVSYQNPTILAGYKIVLQQLKERTLQTDGSELITNPHLRTAYCHADYALQTRLEEMRYN